MIINLLQVILVIPIFILIKYMVWKVTEDKPSIPIFLEYKPWQCRLCLGFWTLTATFLVLGIILHLWITMGVGILLTILDTVAFKVHIKNNTVSVYDLENSDI